MHRCCFGIAVSLSLLAASQAHAHEIPSDVTVSTIVHPADRTLSVLLRVPLDAMQDMSFPTRGPDQCSTLHRPG